jgi:ABC-type Fe3+ transport system permease subunit
MAPLLPAPRVYPRGLFHFFVAGTTLNSWRLGITGLLLVIAGVPLAMPFLDLVGHPEGWQAWREGGRLGALAANTFELAATTLLLVIPAGVLAAILLYRADLPLRGFFRFLIILALFVPLPLVVSAWQAALGAGGWWPLDFWTQPPAGDPDISPGGLAWKPWAHGIGAAAWVHAAVGLPWVILIVGQGLCWVEREMEEDALTVVGPWRVLLHISLPRCKTAIVAAAAWVALQTVSEISATDKMQVRTFAEEVYTQLVGGGPAAIAGSVAVAIPAIILTWLIVGGAAYRLERNLPTLETISRPPVRFALGKLRWLWFFVALLAVIVLVGVPVGSLVWKMGLAGSPPQWSGDAAWSYFSKALQANGDMVVKSLVIAATTGSLTAALALFVSWLALEAHWFRIAIVLFLTAAWALPGPVTGLGLKTAIAGLLDWIGSDPASPDLAARALWYGPSPVPVMWVDFIRFFPFALAMLWPVVRLIPRELRESARLDGARPGQEFRYLILPLSRQALLLTAFAVMVLSLGELSAGKLVETPGWRTLAHVIFDRMHYGVGNDLAAICLVLLGMICLAAIPVAIMGRFLGQSHFSRPRI